MRPYLAILHDSFRFAISSRVLLVMLVLITLFLLLIAPAGYKEQLTTEVLYSEIVNPGELSMRLASAADMDENAAMRRVRDRLSPDLRSSIDKFAQDVKALKESDDEEKSEKRLETPDMGQLVADLNKILADREFYSADGWPRLQLMPEARNLIDKGVATLSEEQLMRLNRLLLESTFANLIERGPPTSIRIVYGPLDFDFVIRTRIETVREQIGAALPKFIDKFLLSIGLLIAALVTAPLIPQTFDPGSLMLQLSKPISRSLLFLSKFAGGCVFTLLCAAYLFTGVMLVLGVRWGLWEPKILWCIPVYVFVFAIYYTVSALAGLIWRNTIVSVIVVMCFWLMCFLIGTAKGIWEDLLEIQRFKQLAVVGDEVIAIDEMNVPRKWDAASKEWAPTLLTESEARQVSFGVFSGQMPGLVGPVADERNDRVLLVKSSWSNWTSESNIGVANAADGFRLQMIGEAPFGTFMVAPEEGGTILAVAGDGKFYRITVPGKEDEVDSSDEEDAPSHLQICGPVESIPFARPFAAAMNPDTQVLAVYSRGTVWLFKTNAQQQYERVATKKLDTEEDALTSLAFAGDALLVAQSSGKLHLLDATLSETKTFEPESNTGPRHVRAAPGGAWFAVAYHTGSLWLIDAESNEIRKAEVKGQGDISAIEFSGPSQLLVCDGGKRVFEYSVGSESLQHTYSPKMGWGERIYRWIVLPVYTLSPKPREFYQTTQFLFSGKKSLAIEGRMEAAQEEIHPWRPVWSSLIFIVVMLGLSCLYVERQEF